MRSLSFLFTVGLLFVSRAALAQAAEPPQAIDPPAAAPTSTPQTDLAAAPIPPPTDKADDKPPPRVDTDEVFIAGTRLSHTAGSAQVIRKDQLERFHYDDPGALLMQVPGVYVRGEDGVGLRPNLAIRGGNPDRSKKLTLMEDGVLFGPAPYSAPAAYYFPLMQRFTQVRVVKGPAAIAYGPHTVGGAVDFVSRPLPFKTSGMLDAAAGDYGYAKLHSYFGSGDGRLGFLVEGIHLANTGFYELPSGADTGSGRNDVMVKVGYAITEDAPTKHRVQLKLSYADEYSNESYLGQTDADFRTNPYRRYPAAALDRMENHRTGLVATHVMEGPESSYRIKTDVYRFDYQRTWRKFNRMEGGAGADILARATDPAFAGYYAVLTGRNDSGSPQDTIWIGPNNRSFVSQGVQSVLSTSTRTGPLDHRLEAGLRFHYDHIERNHTEDAFVMRGSDLVSANQPTLSTTRNKDATHAIALHLTDAMTWRGLTLTPGARVELITSRSEDYLASTSSDGFVGAIMPGVGAYYELLESLGVLGGVYRGFSPPAPGSARQVRPEYSVNYEAGARYARGATRLELIGFLNDYSNLTDICTLSSGCIETNLDRQFDAGRAEVYGLEAYASHTPRAGDLRFPLTAAYTLTDGQFLNDFQSADPLYGFVRRGDSLPYIPLHQLNATIAAEHHRGGVNAAMNYVAPMREQAGSGDISRAVATDEQLWIDFGAYVNVLRWLRVYANLRNAFGAENIVGRRPYGARANAPRWFQLGAKITF